MLVRDAIPIGPDILWDFEDHKLPDFRKDARSFTEDHIEAVDTGGHMAADVACRPGQAWGLKFAKCDGGMGSAEAADRTAVTAEDQPRVVGAIVYFP